MFLPGFGGDGSKSPDPRARRHFNRPVRATSQHDMLRASIEGHDTRKAGQQVFNWKRPYVNIDPRAGHGPDIGGFKKDSQVGVALADGHPVHFIAFRPDPMPGQTIADVAHTEAACLRAVRARHQGSPKPIVVGNCRGGWAAASLAAANRDLAGPIVLERSYVSLKRSSALTSCFAACLAGSGDSTFAGHALNGAPMACWSGRLGQDPMLYTGGVVGSVLPALIASDRGGGIFDGANPVMNLEMLNPGRTRFLDFKRWWGGDFPMNEAEIGWIIDELFVGNRLSGNEARLETGRGIDLKKTGAPVIVFASYGDTITPPQQALNWIADTFADEHEIEILGQRIVYMTHDEVGHLGIFVSWLVARKEHSEMTSTLKTIETHAPGLYEMVISDARTEAIALVEPMIGPVEEIKPHTVERMDQIRHVLGLPVLAKRKPVSKSKTKAP